MAKKVPDYEFRQTKGKYPWDEWLDGEKWFIEEGTDFATSPESFINTARGAASSRGVGLSAAKEDGGVVIQAQTKRGKKK